MITNRGKNTATPSNRPKGEQLTWNEATFSWDQASGTWDSQLAAISNRPKNSASISNRSQS